MRDKTNNPKDIEIIEELERLSMNENFIYDYDHEAVQKKIENSIRNEGIQVGLERGIITGGKEEKTGIAKNMLREKISISTISKCTGLSNKEIEKFI